MLVSILAVFLIALILLHQKSHVEKGEINHMTFSGVLTKQI